MTDFAQARLAQWRDEQGREGLKRELAQMSTAKLTEELNALLDGTPAEEVDVGLVSLYLNLLEERDPVPILLTAEESMVAAKTRYLKTILQSRPL